MRILSRHRLEATYPSVDNYFAREIVKPMDGLGKKDRHGNTIYKQSQFTVIEFPDYQRILLIKLHSYFRVKGWVFHAPRYLPRAKDVLGLLDNRFIASYVSGFRQDASSFNYFGDLLFHALRSSKYRVFFIQWSTRTFFRASLLNARYYWLMFSKGKNKASDYMTVLCLKDMENKVIDKTFYTEIVPPSASNRGDQLSIFSALDCNKLTKQDYEDYAAAYGNPLLSYKHVDHIDTVEFADVDGFMDSLESRQYDYMKPNQELPDYLALEHNLKRSVNVVHHYSKVYRLMGVFYTLNWFITDKGQIIRYLYNRSKGF